MDLDSRFEKVLLRPAAGTSTRWYWEESWISTVQFSDEVPGFAFPGTRVCAYAYAVLPQGPHGLLFPAKFQLSKKSDLKL